MNWIDAAMATLQGTTWNLRAIDILMTVLLTVLIGLSTWALKTVLAHAERFEGVDQALVRIKQQVWGVDGQNGHSSELRELHQSLNGIERSISRLIRRVDRIDYHLKLPEFRDRRDDKEED